MCRARAATTTAVPSASNMHPRAIEAPGRDAAGSGFTKLIAQRAFVKFIVMMFLARTPRADADCSAGATLMRVRVLKLTNGTALLLCCPRLPVVRDWHPRRMKGEQTRFQAFDRRRGRRRWGADAAGRAQEARGACWRAFGGCTWECARPLTDVAVHSWQGQVRNKSKETAKMYPSRAGAAFEAIVACVPRHPEREILFVWSTLRTPRGSCCSMLVLAPGYHHSRQGRDQIAAGQRTQVILGLGVSLCQGPGPCVRPTSGG